MRTLPLVAVAAWLIACSSSSSSGPPASFAGNYSVLVTDKDNGCQLANWTVGQQSQAIPLTVSQNDANATATVNGAVGVGMAFWLGSNTFQGTIAGNSIDVTDYGSTKTTKGTCTYSINARFVGTLSGDSLSGTVTYSAVTNHAADCGAYETCTSVQDLSGSRPPS